MLLTSSKFTEGVQEGNKHTVHGVRRMSQRQERIRRLQRKKMSLRGKKYHSRDEKRAEMGVSRRITLHVLFIAILPAKVTLLWKVLNFHA
jgi:hypothetical protein